MVKKSPASDEMLQRHKDKTELFFYNKILKSLDRQTSQSYAFDQHI